MKTALEALDASPSGYSNFSPDGHHCLDSFGHLILDDAGGGSPSFPTPQLKNMNPIPIPFVPHGNLTDPDGFPSLSGCGENPGTRHTEPGPLLQ